MAKNGMLSWRKKLVKPLTPKGGFINRTKKTDVNKS